MQPPPPYTVSLREADPEGTFIPARDYRPHNLGPEYYANRPVINQGDTYAQDEVIIGFRSGVTTEQQNALMAANGMQFGRPIYGERAFVTKVARGRAMTVANTLRNSPLLEVASVNHVLEGYHDDANDPDSPQQEHLTTINARNGWKHGVGLHQISLVAILDSGTGITGPDNLAHPEFTAKYRPENWMSFLSFGSAQYDQSLLGHGTHVTGLATTSTNNSQYVAGVGYTSWPMSLQVMTNDTACGTVVLASDGIEAVNWAYDHGATVINISWGCSSPNCPLTPGSDMDMLKKAIETAYLRGITVVAAAGNDGNDTPNYPAAFGQVPGQLGTYDERMVIAVGGSQTDHRYVQSSYGDWIDVVAPYLQDDGLGILSTVPTEPNTTCRPNSYTERIQGTSMAAPMVAGLASLLSSLGYSSTNVWQYITAEANDLPPAGRDPETGWGLIDVGSSMEAAHRETSQPPDMVVIPNEGKRGVQWFEFMGSKFDTTPPASPVSICWTPPGGPTSCKTSNPIDHGLSGLGLQPSASNPTGTWSVNMCQAGRCTPTRTFVVNP